LLTYFSSNSTWMFSQLPFQLQNEHKKKMEMAGNISWLIHGDRRN
jgi:hypothetical protein